MKDIRAVRLVSAFMLLCFTTYSHTCQGEEGWTRILNLKGRWKFTIGDNKKWSDPKYSDADWEAIDVPSPWENEGFNGYDGYAWYRKTFDGTDIENKNWNYNLFLGYIDDVDEVYLNGHKIGFSGSFPPRYQTAYNALRNYYIPSEYINFGGKNVIAVRVFDSEISGGIVSGDVGIYTNESDRDLTINLRGLWDFSINERAEKKSYPTVASAPEVPSVSVRWSKIAVPGVWQHQGYNNFNGTAWYRKQFIIPKSLEDEDLILLLGKIDDQDITYLNGKRVGSTNDYSKLRLYPLSADSFHAGAMNLLLIYVSDPQGVGGIYEGPIGIMKQSDFTRYYRSKNR